GTGTTLAKGGINIGTPSFGSVTLKDGRHLDNLGTATWTTGSITFQNGAVFNNNGTFDIQCDIAMGLGLPPGADSAFKNNGVFKKTFSAGGGNVTTITVPFNNDGGTVDVQAGELVFRGSGTSTGPWTVAASAQLTFFNTVTWTLGVGSKVS